MLSGIRPRFHFRLALLPWANIAIAATFPSHQHHSLDIISTTNKSKGAIMDEKKPAKPEPLSEFDKAMKGLAGTPKTEVDEAEEKERKEKESNGEEYRVFSLMRQVCYYHFKSKMAYNPL